MRYILLSAWVICISFFTLSFRSVISVRFTESWIKLMCRKRRLLRKRKIKLLQLLWMQRSVGLRLGCLRRCLSCRGWPWRRYSSLVPLLFMHWRVWSFYFALYQPLTRLFLLWYDLFDKIFLGDFAHTALNQIWKRWRGWWSFRQMLWMAA